MDKRVEFHQAQIKVTVRIVDDEKSHGMRQFDTALLLNTDPEWADVRERIDRAIEQIREQVAEDGASN